jgi:hypothetical protein
MERTLEIKDVFQFCKLLAAHPEEIIKSEQLQKFLNFCYTSVVDCDCKKDNRRLSLDLEKIYMDQMLSMPQDVLDTLGRIFSQNENYTSVFLSFSKSDNKIKLK